MTKEAKYSYKTMWVIIALWTIILVWTWYIAYEHLNWDGRLEIALLVTYAIVLLPIVAYSDVEFEH